jgi:malate synthase
VHHGTQLEDATPITADLVRRSADRISSQILEEIGASEYSRWRFDEARHLLEAVALADQFPEFLTTVAYQQLETANTTTGPTGPSEREGN